MIAGLLFLISVLIHLLGLNDVLDYQFYRHGLHYYLSLLSYMFVHFDWDHLMTNWVFSLPYVIYAERKLGRLGFLGLFLACGLGAVGSFGLINFLRYGHSGVLIGSSGALFGIEGFTLASYCDDLWGKWLCRGVLLYELFAQVQGSFMVMLLHDRGEDHVAYECHLGGLITGVLICLLKEELHDRRRRRALLPCDEDLGKR